MTCSECGRTDAPQYIQGKCKRCYSRLKKRESRRLGSSGPTSTGTLLRARYAAILDHSGHLLTAAAVARLKELSK